MNSSSVIGITNNEEGNIEHGCSNVSIKQQICAEGNIEDNCTNVSIKQDLFASPCDGEPYTEGRTANMDEPILPENGTCQSNRLGPLLTSFAGVQQPHFGMVVSQHAAQVGLSCQFWKAGDYDIRPTATKSMQGGIDHIRVHPKFLHSNATSHKWALGAIAELLDNAVDEIQNGATYVSVNSIRNPRDNSTALLVKDDGGGMDPDCMRRCMCLGYSQKNTRATIGQYGNGFKTSTMRLGADVIVFSSSNHNSIATQSIGLLSFTFLRETGHEDIVVPMVDYKLSSNDRQRERLIRSSEEDWAQNLLTILQWSPYSIEADLLEQFDDIGPHGTKIIIYNLWLNDDGQKELDFESDPEDIQLRGSCKVGKLDVEKELSEKHIANRLRYSLRAYSSVLYLEMPNNFKIILRGRPVEHHRIADDLKFCERVMYKPQLGGIKEVSVITTIGFTKEAPLINVHGFSVYHRNRLILPFWRVVQENSSRGRGVVGVLEAEFMEPAHDKQDFERTAVFSRLETRLKQMTLEYWNLHCELIGYKKPTKNTNVLKISARSLPPINQASLSTGSHEALSQRQDSISFIPGQGSAGVACTLGTQLGGLASVQMPLPVAILRPSSFDTMPLQSEMHPEEGSKSQQLIIAGVEAATSICPYQSIDVKPITSKFVAGNQVQLCLESSRSNSEEVLLRDIKPDLSTIFSRGIPLESSTYGEATRSAASTTTNILSGRSASGLASAHPTISEDATAALMDGLQSVRMTDRGGRMISNVDSGCHSGSIYSISIVGPSMQPELKRKISFLSLCESESSKRQVCGEKDSITDVQTTSADAALGHIPPTLGQISSVENQTAKNPEIEVLWKENMRLRVQIHEYETRLEESQETVINLESELQKLQGDYAKLLIEAQSLASVKLET